MLKGYGGAGYRVTRLMSGARLGGLEIRKNFAQGPLDPLDRGANGFGGVCCAGTGNDGLQRVADVMVQEGNGFETPDFPHTLVTLEDSEGHYEDDGDASRDGGTDDANASFVKVAIIDGPLDAECDGENDNADK